MPLNSPEQHIILLVLGLIDVVMISNLLFILQAIGIAHVDRMTQTKY